MVMLFLTLFPTCDNKSEGPTVTDEIESGIELIGQREPELARSQFNTALEKHPENPYAHLGIALADWMLALENISQAAEFAATFLRGLAEPSGAAGSPSLSPRDYNRSGPAMVFPQQLDPGNLISLYLDPVLERMEEADTHLEAITLENFALTVPSLPVQFRFDQVYEIDMGGEIDEFEIRILGSLTDLFRASGLILKSLNLGAGADAFAGSFSFPLDITNPTDALARIRQSGVVFSENPSFLTVANRADFQSGLSVLNEALEWIFHDEGSLWQALLKKDGSEPAGQVIGFVDEDADGAISEGDRLMLNPLDTWSISDPPWFTKIYLPAGIELFISSLEEILGTITSGLAGESAFLEFSDLNPFFSALGFGNEGKFPVLPDVARLDLAALLQDFPDPRNLLFQSDWNGEFMIEAEVSSSELFPDGISWVFRGDTSHFGETIPADGIAPSDDNPASFIPYFAFSDPTFSQSLEIRGALSESASYYPADLTSLNSLIASLYTLYSTWFTSSGLPPTTGGRFVIDYEEYVLPIDQGEISSVSQVNIQDVFFTNREGTILAGRLFWPESATTSATVPGVVYCPGTVCWLDLYHWIAMELAQAGYATMVFEPGGQAESRGNSDGASPYWFSHYLPPGWENDLYDSVSYLYRFSPIAELVDSEKIGIMGHSRGAWAVCNEQLGDIRVKAAIQISGGSPGCSPFSRIPTQLQTADFDLLDLGQPFWGPLSNSLYYTMTNSPRQLIVIAAGSHGGFNTVEGEGADSPWNMWLLVPEWQHPTSAHYAIAWFDYYLKEDPSARDRITEPISGLSHLFPSKYLLDHIEEEVTMWP